MAEDPKKKRPLPSPGSSLGYQLGWAFDQGKGVLYPESVGEWADSFYSAAKQSIADSQYGMITPWAKQKAQGVADTLSGLGALFGGKEASSPEQTEPVRDRRLPPGQGVLAPQDSQVPAVAPSPGPGGPNVLAESFNIGPYQPLQLTPATRSPLSMRMEDELMQLAQSTGPEKIELDRETTRKAAFDGMVRAAAGALVDGPGSTSAMLAALGAGAGAGIEDERNRAQNLADRHFGMNQAVEAQRAVLLSGAIDREDQFNNLNQNLINSMEATNHQAKEFMRINGIKFMPMANGLGHHIQTMSPDGKVEFKTVYDPMALQMQMAEIQARYNNMPDSINTSVGPLANWAKLDPENGQTYMRNVQLLEGGGNFSRIMIPKLAEVYWASPEGKRQQAALVGAKDQAHQMERINWKIGLNWLAAHPNEAVGWYMFTNQPDTFKRMGGTIEMLTGGMPLDEE